MNARKGKIASHLLFREDLHRLKGVPDGSAWFAPERPRRRGRPPPDSGASSVRAGANAGGTAEGEPFVPSFGEERRFVLSGLFLSGLVWNDIQYKGV